MSNAFRVKNALNLSPVDLTTLTSPQAGDLACDINDSNKIKRYDANAAAWTEVGSGGVGGTDIFFVQDFESASLSSFTQTGLTLSQTDPLHGRVSALLTHQPAINQSFKQIIPVDRKFRGETMTLRLNCKSNAPAGDVTINIYDETNAANLVASQQLQLSNDASGAISRVGFTIPETCASISYTITALPEAGSPVTRIDDIIAELAVTSLLETAVEVPVVTAWQGYTPTFQGFGTPTNVEFEWRQVGENAEIRGKFTSGVSTGVEARIGLPAGLSSAGTSLIPSIQSSGTYFNSKGTADKKGGAVFIEPSVSYVTLGAFGTFGTTAVIATAKALGTSVSESGDSTMISVSVPCAGLSATSTKTIPLTQSGLVQEADSNFEIGTPVGASTNTLIRTFSGIFSNSGDAVLYTKNATLGDSITILKDGVYNINYSEGFTTAGIGFAITKNYAINTAANSIPRANVLAFAFSEDAVSWVNQISFSGKLVTGDVIRFATGTNSTIGNAYQGVSISYQGSLKQVSVSSDQKITIPTSELRFEGASTRGSTATAIVKFDTMAKLRGDAFTVESDAVLGTRITMKKAGKLDISTSIVMSSGQGIAITKNQTTLTSFPSISSEILSADATDVNGLRATGSYQGFVVVGDIIRISTTVAPTANASNQFNLSFQEQDIAVSVTNTLPQFSESDSSVDLNTNNGYGSTLNNKIRRFSNLTQNLGTSIEYLDSATNGASFTIKESGIYNISYSESFGSASSYGISKNASSLTNNITLLPAAEALSFGYIDTANAVDGTSWQGYLNIGDVIRPHANGIATGTGAAYAHFTISKVGKPNVTGVDVTPFVNVPQPENQSSQQYNGSTVVTGAVVYTGVLTSTNGSALYSYNSTSGVYTILKNCKINLSITARSNAAVAATIYINKGTSSIAADSTAATANLFASCSIEVDGFTGDTFTFGIANAAATNFHVIAVTATALSDQILTAPETFSTDTAALAYSSTYTLATLSSAPIGSYITFTYAINTNTRTQTSTRPTQTDADMNANGMLIYTRAYNAASTAAQPAVFAIQIGKGHKGRTLDLYKSTGKTTSGSMDFYNQSSTISLGIQHKEYNESTGILFLDAGFNNITTITTSTLYYSDLANQSSGYLVINASKSPVITGFGLNRISARAINTSGTAYTSTRATLTFDASKIFDTNGALNAATGVFTAPETGYYSLSSGVAFASAAYTAGQFIEMSVFKNGVLYSIIGNFVVPTAITTSFGTVGSDQVFLGKNDTLSISVRNSRGSTALDTTAGINYFTVSKVSV